MDHHIHSLYSRVYKFKMDKQLALLGCRYDDRTVVLELLGLGFDDIYRDAKKSS